MLREETSQIECINGRVDVKIDGLRTAAYTIATDEPESDGTLAWKQTTLVLVHAAAGGQEGIGYTYADLATAHLIDELLKDRAVGRQRSECPCGLEWDDACDPQSGAAGHLLHGDRGRRQRTSGI